MKKARWEALPGAERLGYPVTRLLISVARVLHWGLVTFRPLWSMGSLGREVCGLGQLGSVVCVTLQSDTSRCMAWAGASPPTSAILSSRTELNLHQMAESSAFGMGTWSKVSGLPPGRTDIPGRE